MNSENQRINTMEHSEKSSKEFYIGLCLAITSTIFIGSSFVIKKVGLIRLNRKGLLRAGSGGFGYLREWIWWIGLIIMGIGELSNFAAYAFAPASLVTPLGALSVLISTILATKFLNERLNTSAKMGCVLCILGTTCIILSAPKNESIENLSTLLEKVDSLAFKVYVILIICNLVAVKSYFGRKYGDKNVLVYIILCSGIGSLTVNICKVLGVAIKESLTTNKAETNNFQLIVSCFVIVLFCIVIQLNYLNKALDLFNMSVVTPIYYVFFTSFVVATSCLIFSEWTDMEFLFMFGLVCGFLILIVATFMMNSMREIDDVTMGKYELLKI